MDLGDADPSSMVASDRAPLLALAGGDAPFVQHWVCDEHAESEEDCVLTTTALQGLTGGNAVLITSAGNYVVATHTDKLAVLGWKVERDAVRPFEAAEVMPPIDQVARLVASLRNSDIVIARDLQGRLVRFDPRYRDAVRIAPKVDDLMLAAVGEQDIVGRVLLDDENEELWLVPVDRPVNDRLQDPQPDPIRLSTRGRASRIVVTPRDEFVVITYGQGDSAHTQVFRGSDGLLLQGWDGAMVSGRDDGGELPGLRAVSPDGSHVAYRTQQGSLAMRSLVSHSSCLVHSSMYDSATRLAGFSADGVLYFETDDGPGRTGINTWTPHFRERRQLSIPDDGFSIVAVPGRSARDGKHPWAVGVDDGRFAALQAEEAPEFLGMQDAVFAPRDDANVWAIHTASPVGSGERHVGLRRIVPRWNSQLRALVFDDPTDPGSVPSTQPDAVPRPLQLVFDGPTRVCMSTGAPGSWAYTCGTASDRTFLAAPTTPSSEDPFGNTMHDPEVPTVGDAWSCGDKGQPNYQAQVCKFEADSCCFAYKSDACDWLNCNGKCVNTSENDVECAE